MDVQDFIVNRDQHMRPLEYDLSENFNELVRYLNDVGVLDNVPVGVTAESEIASVSDAYPAPPRALTVYGKSTQDGTPTPDAPVPILSVDELALNVCGKNLFDPTLLKNQAGWNRIQLYVPVGTTLTMSTNMPSGTGLPLYFITSTGTQGSATIVHSAHSVTQTVNADGYVWVIQRRAEGTDSFANYEWQLELGSIATAYAPYVGTTVPDLLPEGTDLRSLPDGTKDTLNLSYLRPSTREGWAWYSRVVTRGVGHVADMGALVWARYGPSSNNHYSYGSDSINNVIVGAPNNNTVANVLSPSYQADTYARTYSYGIESIAVSNTGRILVCNIEFDSSDKTAAEFKTAMSGVTLLYQRKTPITTTLDPIELPTLPAPNATVWCDGGSAQPTLVLEYVRDANATIAELSEAIADIVSG